jgi:hypothetical protein
MLYAACKHCTTCAPNTALYQLACWHAFAINPSRPWSRWRLGHLGPQLLSGVLPADSILCNRQCARLVDTTCFRNQSMSSATASVQLKVYNMTIAARTWCITLGAPIPLAHLVTQTPLSRDPHTLSHDAPFLTYEPLPSSLSTHPQPVLVPPPPPKTHTHPSTHHMTPPLCCGSGHDVQRDAQQDQVHDAAN